MPDIFRHTFSKERGLRFVARSFWDGLLSRLRRLGARSQTTAAYERIGAFYRRARLNEAEEKIVDSSDSEYMRFALGVIGTLAGTHDLSAATLIDLGCGRGLLESSVNSVGLRPKRYIGVDAFIDSEQRRRHDGIKTIFVEGDVCDFVYDQGDDAIIIMINSLCYQFDIATIVENMSKPASVKHVVIIDPYPSLFWENYFSGIYVTLRTHREICKAMENAGWASRVISRLYLFRLGTWYFLPVTHGIVFSRRNGDA